MFWDVSGQRLRVSQLQLPHRLRLRELLLQHRQHPHQPCGAMSIFQEEQFKQTEKHFQRILHQTLSSDVYSKSEKFTEHHNNFRLGWALQEAAAVQGWGHLQDGHRHRLRHRQEQEAHILWQTLRLRYVELSNVNIFPVYLLWGGILGLFTGMSILSMVEVIFWIVRYLIKKT